MSKNEKTEIDDMWSLMQPPFTPGVREPSGASCDAGCISKAAGAPSGSIDRNLQTIGTRSSPFPLGPSELFPRGFSSSSSVFCCSSIEAVAFKHATSVSDTSRPKHTELLIEFLTGMKLLVSSKSPVPIHRNAPKAMFDSTYIFEVHKFIYHTSTWATTSNRRYFIYGKSKRPVGCKYWEILLDGRTKFDYVSELMQAEVSCNKFGQCGDIMDSALITMWAVNNHRSPVQVRREIVQQRHVFCCRLVKLREYDSVSPKEARVEHLQAFISAMQEVGPVFEVETAAILDTSRVIFEVHYDQMAHGQMWRNPRYFTWWISQFCEVRLASDIGFSGLTKLIEDELRCLITEHSDNERIRITLRLFDPKERIDRRKDKGA